MKVKARGKTENLAWRFISLFYTTCNTFFFLGNRGVSGQGLSPQPSVEPNTIGAAENGL